MEPTGVCNVLSGEVTRAGETGRLAGTVTAPHGDSGGSYSHLLSSHGPPHTPTTLTAARGLPKLSEAEAASCSAWRGATEDPLPSSHAQGALVCPTNSRQQRPPGGHDKCPCSRGSGPKNWPQGQELGGKLDTRHPQGQRTWMARAPRTRAAAEKPRGPAQMEAGVPSLSPAWLACCPSARRPDPNTLRGAVSGATDWDPSSPEPSRTTTRR